MRSSTWAGVQQSSLLRAAYSRYRRLPAPLRTPLRWLLLPQWEGAVAIVRLAARNRIVDGPFKGIRLLLSDVSKRLLPSYLLGSSELELRDVIEKIIAREYGTILNIGAADGYYAVGFARRCFRSQIVAFESLSHYHSIIRDSALLNGVANQVRVTGHCDHAGLRAELVNAQGSVLIFADIEGFETQLLNPTEIPQLKFADIVIETHDAFVADCTRTMIERLRQTHQIDRITARPRTLDDFPKKFLPLLPKYFPALALDLMDERRAGTQQWLYCKAKSEGSMRKTPRKRK
jgi:hypothetical protein